MLGTYGMSAQVTPSGYQGPLDRYTDVALDGQWDRQWPSGGSLVAHGSWIHENRHLAATLAGDGADHPDGTLSTIRADATWMWPSRVGLSAGLFSTTGSADAAFYPTDPVTGSATGSPDSRGYIAELSFMPWLNTRLGLEYVGYTKFDGASRNYDGSGRNAADNNTLYLMTWLVF